MPNKQIYFRTDKIEDNLCEIWSPQNEVPTNRPAFVLVSGMGIRYSDRSDRMHCDLAHNLNSNIISYKQFLESNRRYSYFGSFPAMAAIETGYPIYVIRQSPEIRHRLKIYTKETEDKAKRTLKKIAQMQDVFPLYHSYGLFTYEPGITKLPGAVLAGISGLEQVIASHKFLQYARRFLEPLQHFNVPILNFLGGVRYSDGQKPEPKTTKFHGTELVMSTATYGRGLKVNIGEDGPQEKVPLVIITNFDRIIKRHLQAGFAQAIGAKTKELDSGHRPFTDGVMARLLIDILIQEFDTQKRQYQENPNGESIGI